MPAIPGHASGRAILDSRPVHIGDVQTDRDYDLRGVVGAGRRSVLAVPMLRDGTAIGTITVHQERAMVAPIYELAFLTGVGRRVEESALGLIGGYAFSAPYEDVKLRAK